MAAPTIPATICTGRVRTTTGARQSASIVRSSSSSARKFINSCSSWNRRFCSVLVASDCSGWSWWRNDSVSWFYKSKWTDYVLHSSYFAYFDLDTRSTVYDPSQFFTRIVISAQLFYGSRGHSGSHVNGQQDHSDQMDDGQYETENIFPIYEFQNVKKRRIFKLDDFFWLRVVSNSSATFLTSSQSLEFTAGSDLGGIRSPAKDTTNKMNT